MDAEARARKLFESWNVDTYDQNHADECIKEFAWALRIERERALEDAALLAEGHAKVCDESARFSEEYANKAASLRRLMCAIRALKERKP